MEVDVVIIGTGPAGCAAAITCCKAGLQTLMVTMTADDAQDKRMPYQTQPSESIHPGVTSLLSQLQASHAVSIAFTGKYEGVQTGNHFAPLGTSPDTGTWYGAHINRYLFDQALVQTAKGEGVQVINNEIVDEFICEKGWVVGIKTASGKEIPCRYVIDASGYKRIAGKKLHFKEVFYSPPLVTWTGTSIIPDANHPLFQNHFTKFIPRSSGWTWLAPEPPHRCTWTMLSIKGKQLFEPPDELKEFSISKNIKTANRRWRIFRPLCKEGVILCGDAAAIIDPAAGQGVLQALLSGIQAARTIISCFTDPDHESLYLNNYDQWFLQLYEDKIQKLKKYYIDNEIKIFQSAGF